jgi:hypothetical protein
VNAKRKTRIRGLVFHRHRFGIERHQILEEARLQKNISTDDGNQPKQADRDRDALRPTPRARGCFGLRDFVLGHDGWAARLHELSHAFVSKAPALQTDGLEVTR